MKQIKDFLLISVIAGLVATTACNKAETTNKPKDDSTSQNTDGNDPDAPKAGEIAIENDPGLAVPRHLAVTSVTEEQSAESLQAGEVAIATSLQLQDSNDPSYFARTKLMMDLLKSATKEQCADAIPQEISLNQGGLGSHPCFGPALTYTNHPDNGSNGDIGNGDLGMFRDYAESDSTQDKTACASGVLNNLGHVAAAYTNTATGLSVMVACAAKNAGIGLPETAEKTTDLTSVISEIPALNQVSLDSASVSREKDAAGDVPVYSVTMAGKLKDEPRNLEKSFELTVRQFAETSDAKKYRGVIQFRIKNFEDSKDLGISIVYKWGDKRLSYRYRQLQMEPTASDVFDSTNGELIPGDDPSRLQDIVADVNNIGIGKFSYVWSTSDYLVFNAETKTDGTGVAFFGHHPKETTPNTEGFYDIKALRCFPVNPPPANKEPYSNYVQRQTLKLNADNGRWELDESNIKYAPVTSCSWNTENDEYHNAQFKVSWEQNNPDAQKVEQILSFPYEQALYSLTDYKTAWTAPVPPTLQ